MKEGRDPDRDEYLKNAIRKLQKRAMGSHRPDVGQLSSADRVVVPEFHSTIPER